MRKKVAFELLQYELKNSERNKLDKQDNAFHDWYRFVLSFPPHLVRKYIKEFGLTPEDIVLDPFCGTGTTLVEAKLQGIPSIGIEANYFVHFASSTKIDWDIDHEALLSTAKDIRELSLREFNDQNISDSPELNYVHLLDTELFQALNQEKNKLIIKDSISKLPLHKSLVLLNQINKYKESPFHKYLMIALGNSLVFKISNLRFGPEVGVGKLKTDSSVIEPWFNQIIKICADIKFHSENKSVSSSVLLSDSRNLKDLLGEKQISAVITSPPYPNEKDYTRTTRLESVLLGFINSKEELRALKKTLLRSNTRGVYKDDNDDEYIKGFPEIIRIANEIETRRIEAGKTSGFERLYHKVTKLYFGGIAKHLIELQSILKPNAYL
ncbi:TRM11 family SAM-dependent methyltransferase, partial [Mucilaginibacter sp.]|uniref:TRM11 family SAM-dependent methyltransferase n=1 Tax=Mucilaginibacter sp. TaxID=1882438 RepID=UPI002ECFDD14